MYYGNSANEIDMATSTGVWDSDFKGVWHLDEVVVDESSLIGAFADSSLYSNDADQYYGNENIGWIYGSQVLEGDDYINIPDTNDLDITDDLTMSAWVNVNSPAGGTYKRVLTLNPATPSANYQVEVILTPENFNYSQASTTGADL
jgi:hypothetical protein